MGSALYWMGVDVYGPRYGWSMRQALAMLLVPDNFNPIPSTPFLSTISTNDCFSTKALKQKGKFVNPVLFLGSISS